MFFTWLCILVHLGDSTVYLQEEFDANWDKRWVQSQYLEYARFTLSPGWWYPDVTDTGILTETMDQQYVISRKFPSFSMKERPLVVQFTLRMHQDPICGGNYLKVLPKNFDGKRFNSNSKFLLMFGPDICEQNEKIHILLPYKGVHYQVNKEMTFPNDTLTHQLTLIVKPDFSVVYLLDNSEVFSGNLKKDFGEVMIDSEVYEINDIGGVGFELFQTVPGSLFDNIFIGDSVEEAYLFSVKTFLPRQKNEPEALEKFKESQEKIRTDYNKEHLKRYDIENDLMKKMGKKLKVGEKVFF
jgi:hypothetical protein